MIEDIHFLSFASRLGWILLAATESGIALLHFCGSAAPTEDEIHKIIGKTYPEAAVRADNGSPLLKGAKDAVLRYIHEGESLPPISIDIETGTPFQQRVWEELRRIPFGETRTYNEVAARIGSSQSYRAARAVGQACARNPVAILVPCHRVVGSGGKLGGYSGGTAIKTALLEIEQKPSAAS